MLFSTGDIGLGDVSPNREGACARGTTILRGRLLGIGNVEEVGDLIVNRQKPLCLPGRFGSLHNPFASPCRLVRILRTSIHFKSVNLTVPSMSFLSVK